MATINLSKRLESAEATGDAKLINLSKTAAINLSKKGIELHTAKVAMIMDISGSMDWLFSNGTVMDVSYNALSQGVVFDDDGMIDVFTFGQTAQYEGEFGVADLDKFRNKVTQLKHKLQPDTDYALALKSLADHYKGNTGGLPVYVNFITDGDCNSVERAMQALRELAKQKIYVQFIGIGKKDHFSMELIEKHLVQSVSAPATQSQPEPKKSKGFLSSLSNALFGSDESSSSATVTSNAAAHFNPQQFKSLAQIMDQGKRENLTHFSYFAVQDISRVKSELLFDLMTEKYFDWVK